MAVEELSQNDEKLVLKADSGIHFQNGKGISTVQNSTLDCSREESVGEAFQWDEEGKLLLDSTCTLSQIIQIKLVLDWTILANN